jgi:hypothetical protein
MTAAAVWGVVGFLASMIGTLAVGLLVFGILRRV